MTTQKYLNTIGEEIREQRKFLRLTQKQLTQGTGVSHGALSRIERGLGSSLETLIRVCDLLDLYPSELMKAVDARHEATE